MSFDEDAAFLAFIDACEQKPMEAELLGALIGDLGSQAVVLAGDRPLKMFFPGIGEGEQAAVLAESINRSTQRLVEVRGVDASPRLTAIATERLEANENVAAVELVVSDAFGGGERWPTGNDVAIASHVLYYAPSEHAGVEFVASIVAGLAPGGVLVLMHEGPAPSAMAALRERHNRHRIVHAPTLLVERAATELRTPVYRIDYISKLRFPRVSKRQVAAAIGSPAEDDVEAAKMLIEFTLQRGLEELKAQRVLTALDDFYSQLNSATHELEWQLQMQIVPYTELGADPERLSALEASVERTRARVPGIEKRHFG